MRECCERLKAILGDYLDLTLDPDLCQELESHLGDCDPCRLVVETTQRTIQFYCNSRPLSLPPGVEQRLRERLQMTEL